MRDSKRDTDVYSRLSDSEGEGDGGMIWENGNIHTTICKVGSWWGAAVFYDPLII